MKLENLKEVKSATGIIAKKGMRLCCRNWQELVGGLRVGFYGKEYKFVEGAVKKLLLFTLGNYCPTCGGRLR